MVRQRCDEWVRSMFLDQCKRISLVPAVRNPSKPLSIQPFQTPFNIPLPNIQGHLVHLLQELNPRLARDIPWHALPMILSEPGFQRVPFTVHASEGMQAASEWHAPVRSRTYRSSRKSVCHMVVCCPSVYPALLLPSIPPAHTSSFPVSVCQGGLSRSMSSSSGGQYQGVARLWSCELLDDVQELKLKWRCLRATKQTGLQGNRAWQEGLQTQSDRRE